MLLKIDYYEPYEVKKAKENEAIEEAKKALARDQIDASRANPPQVRGGRGGGPPYPGRGRGGAGGRGGRGGGGMMPMRPPQPVQMPGFQQVPPMYAPHPGMQIAPPPQMYQ